jgi:hypothetical protein
MTVHEIEEVELPEFLICALDGGGCQRYATAALSEEKCSRYPLSKKLCEPHSRCERFSYLSLPGYQIMAPRSTNYHYVRAINF